MRSYNHACHIHVHVTTNAHTTFSSHVETVALNTDSLSVSVNSASNTSISLSLTLNEKLATVTNYSISYFNTNSTQCFTDSNDITGIAGSETVYTLTGLEEGTEYSVTVSATFSSGESLRKVVVCTTTEIGKYTLLTCILL